MMRRAIVYLTNHGSPPPCSNRMTAPDYLHFLTERRKLMAKKIRNHYLAL